VSGFAADATVAPQGDGQFKSIHEAIMAAPPNLPSAERPWVIAVKPGVYKELIYVQQERRFIKLIGEDARTTIITMNLHANLPGLDGKPIGTFRTPTVQIDGDGFSAENITFENSAGPVGQALALRVDADKVQFKNCRFLGWQDTIFLNRGRQYFENCYITGHVDFIFGAATAFFEQCQLHVLRDGYITAASTPADREFGFVFSRCSITGETSDVKTYLGRPWRAYGQTVFLRTKMSANVRSEAWHNWTGPEREKTARYAEFGSTGAGGDLSRRVKWARQLSETEAASITREKVLGDWNPLAPVSTIAARPQTNPYENPFFNGRLKTDLEFAQAGGESLKLDVFTPSGKGPFPAVIFVHGGGWSGGDKKGGNDPLFLPVARRNIAWFTINYRLAPKHNYPAPIEDIHAAIRWVRSHAKEFNVDPARIALVGESAGGQIVAQAVVLAKEDVQVAAAVPFYAPTDFVLDMERRGGLSTSMRGLFGRREAMADEATLQLLREASPINHIRPGLPPFLLVHGTGDMSVLYNWSPLFQSKLKAAGVACDLMTIPDGTHGMANWENIAPDYKDKVADWLAVKLRAQIPRDFSQWEKEIAAYEQEDRTSAPPKGGALFIGSSTIRLWKSLAADFPQSRVINRGFGGSQIVDATHFADRLIFSHKPKQIFLRSGGNDLHMGKTPEQVLADFQEFVATVHSKLPQTEIVYISLCPSVARWSEAADTKKLNALVQAFISGKPRLKYIETYSMSLGTDGQPRPELFIEDKLHFNAEGYKRLSALVRPYLKK
jgi:pectinesterase